MGGIYGCNRCVDPLDKAKREREDPILKTVREIKEHPELFETRGKDVECKTLEIVLKSLPQREWIAIKDITKGFRANGYSDMSGRRMTVILSACGFKDRKRGTHGYIFVRVHLM